MKIIIDSQKEIDVIWMEGPTLADGSVWLKTKEDGPLHELIGMLEKAQEIKKIEDEGQEEIVYKGLKLTQVQKKKDGTVFVQFDNG